MHTKLLLASLGFCCLSANAQNPSDIAYAEPAFRSPVVAVEFTGQRCRYCPNLARALQGSETKYGKENYIITALHSLEQFSLLPSQHVSLFHPEAMQYAKSIKVHDGLPQLAYNTLGPTVSDVLLDDMFKEDDLLECTGKVTVNGKKEYVIDIQTRLRSNMKESVAGKQIDILFWALENDIVALQDDNGRWTYPAHQHIFRGSINGTWGESFQPGTNYQSAWPIPAGVSVVENTEVIAFFLDHETRTILDAARIQVQKGDATGVGAMQLAPKDSRTPIYDLNGRQVFSTVKGRIYIQNGKKFVAE